MNCRPLVSILINNYNYGRFLGEAIDSALTQTYSNTEVIVVDDGSTDNSREVIAGYGQRIIPVLKENGGQASAFNAGFAASKGDIICFLDSDDVFLPEKVVEVVKVFEKQGDIAWCFHRLKKVDLHTGTVLELTRGGTSRKCDFRFRMRMGGKPPLSSATSGICFKQSFLNHVLPMPEASTVMLSDGYLKRTAFASTRGFHLGKALGLLRIHGTNAYSYRKDRLPVTAKIDMLTAFWMQVKYPWLARYNNRVFARSMSILRRAGEIDGKYATVVKDYLSAISPLERIEIGLIAFLYGLRYKITGKIFYQ